MSALSLQWQLFQMLKQDAFCHESIDSCPQQVQHIRSHQMLLLCQLQWWSEYSIVPLQRRKIHWFLWWHTMALLTTSSFGREESFPLVNHMARLKLKNFASSQFFIIFWISRCHWQSLWPIRVTILCTS